MASVALRSASPIWRSALPPYHLIDILTQLLCYSVTRARWIPPPKSNREKIQPSDPRWHTRGYLPHFEAGEIPQHITFHLADSLPKDAILRLENELTFQAGKERGLEKQERLNDWLDAGHGACLLRHPAFAEIAQNTLKSLHLQRYRLLAWVVMPNHVHVLFKPLAGWSVADTVGFWKKFSARKICEWQRSHGGEPASPVWQREYWDRYMRDSVHVARTVDYIHQNPVQAGLRDATEKWEWSSAFPNNKQFLDGP